jgi:ribosomal RNA-processing protein 1
VLPFLKAFWATMARQWTLLDVLRMDKYLLLVRRYLSASFEWLKKNNWEEKFVEEHSRMLEGEGGVLNPTATVPDGLRYHVLDCSVDELSKVDQERVLSEAVLELLMRPIRELTVRGRTRVLRERAKEVMKDKRLENWAAGEGDEGKDELNEDEEWEGIKD